MSWGKKVEDNAKGEGADAENLGRAAKKRIGASFLNAGWAAKEREKHRMWMAVGDSVAYERRALNRKIKRKKCDYAVLTLCNNARDRPVHATFLSGSFRGSACLWNAAPAGFSISRQNHSWPCRMRGGRRRRHCACCKAANVAANGISHLTSGYLPFDPLVSPPVVGLLLLAFGYSPGLARCLRNI